VVYRGNSDQSPGTQQLNGVDRGNKPVSGRRIRATSRWVTRETIAPGYPVAFAGPHSAEQTRPARPRTYLMCPPTYFDVRYAANPWADTTRPADRQLAFAQWAWVRDLYRDLGHHVSEIPPLAGLPDMLFTANAATVVDGRVLLAKAQHEQRAAEARAHRDWFRAHGFREVYAAAHENDGEADCLLAGGQLLCGTGFRTSRRAHGEVAEVLRRPATSLTLVDPRFFHLDIALSVLSEQEITYYPLAFSPESQELLGRLYPDAIIATDADAEVFGLNAVSDGRHVVLPQEATNLIGQLRERRFIPLGVDVSELVRAGGGVKRCTLELRT
jgi:N-dimethylarginine dimethylaminohydrolase